MKLSKLVRDNIPEMIQKRNQAPVTHIASDTEYKEKLIQKLREECEEFIKDENPEELADILEVVYTLGDIQGIEKPKLEEMRVKKAKERGTFKEKIILDEIT